MHGALSSCSKIELVQHVACMCRITDTVGSSQRVATDMLGAQGGIGVVALL